MTNPTTGMTKKPTTAAASPHSRVELGMPERARRLPGMRYFATSAAMRTSADTAKTVHAAGVFHAMAHTRMAPPTNGPEG